MICPYCGADMEPVNHNDRGWRCAACWAKVPEPKAEPEVSEVEEKPARRGRPPRAEASSGKI